MEFPSAGLTTDTIANDGVSGVGDANRSPFGAENLAWSFQVLPFIEQQTVANLRNGSGPSGVQGTNGIYAEEVSIPAYICPSRSERSNTISSSGASSDRRFVADYSGFMGAGRFDATRTTFTTANPVGTFQTASGSAPIGTGDTSEQNLVWVGIIAPAGISGTNAAGTPAVTTRFSRIGFGAMSDGSSNTVMLGEKSASSLEYNTINSQWELNGFVQPTDFATMRSNFGGLLADNEIGTVDSAGINRMEVGFGSAHPGTTNFVLGDGSTHSFSNNIPEMTLYQAGHRSDGSNFDVTDF